MNNLYAFSLALWLEAFYFIHEKFSRTKLYRPYVIIAGEGFAVE
ncbi:hypothetical protein [Virgibacillus sp. YIM 98842]|nr:hypothetical protein [Virgibacillus sp. YIM 98842]